MSGGNALSAGHVDSARTDDIVRSLLQKGFAHVSEPSARSAVQIKAREMDHAAYVAMFGPTVGDRVQLGDTGLFVEVEWDSVWCRCSNDEWGRGI